ncbi:unnamed protein product [Periconia digitata]|uniref:BTB domain-containing protein n=1 Tax=Periconia digitata TaxID=1303443 RepID=A0A9W4XRP5_9PLEO|nr:unnamed protein product [Periconia digitata]
MDDNRSRLHQLLFEYIASNKIIWFTRRQLEEVTHSSRLSEPHNKPRWLDRPYNSGLISRMSFASSQHGTEIGTDAVPPESYSERSSEPGMMTEVFNTISAQSTYRNFSVEELRHVDYKRGRKGARESIVASSADVESSLPKTNIERRGHLALMQGPEIEIIVGGIPTAQQTTATTTTTNSTHDNTWSLPKKLISHFSPFLKAACSGEFKERAEGRIELPEDDVRIFGLFVQWMYDGYYTLTLPNPEATVLHENVSIHAQCWILGDKLLSSEFKNYAMGRLYASHVAAYIGGPAVTTDEVGYVCENTTPNSKLRSFYFDFLSVYFQVETRLVGSIEEWDEFVLEHSDVRLHLLRNFRDPFKRRVNMQGEDEYMENVDGLESTFQKMGL